MKPKSSVVFLAQDVVEASGPSLLFGFNPVGLDVVITSSLALDVIAERFSTLREFFSWYSDGLAKDEKHEKLPRLVGFMNSLDTPCEAGDELEILKYRSEENYWISMAKSASNKYPHISEIMSCSFRYETVSKVIIYESDPQRPYRLISNFEKHMPFINLSHYYTRELEAFLGGEESPGTHESFGKDLGVPGGIGLDIQFDLNTLEPLEGSDRLIMSKGRISMLTYFLIKYKLQKLRRGKFLTFQNILDSFLGLAFLVVFLSRRKHIYSVVSSAFEFFPALVRFEMRLLNGGTLASLKFNDRLNEFLNSLFYIISSYSHIAVQTSLPTILNILSLFLCFTPLLGITVLVSMFLDLYHLLNYTIVVFSKFTGGVYAQIRGIISSLFLLFKGNKRNVLQGRIESAEYTINQTLVGTIFFTMALFLFPTIAVYNLIFEINKLILKFVMLCGWMVVVAINKFPFEELYVRHLRIPSSSSYLEPDLEFAEFEGTNYYHIRRLGVPMDAVLKFSFYEEIQNFLRRIVP